MARCHWPVAAIAALAIRLFLLSQTSPGVTTGTVKDSAGSLIQYHNENPVGG